MREISTEPRSLAALQFEAGRIDWVIKYLEQACDLDPSNPDAAVELVVALGRAQRYVDAHDSLRRAVERGVLERRPDQPCRMRAWLTF